MTLIGAGVIVSTIITGIYFRLYRQPILAFLPDSLRLTLDEMHDQAISTDQPYLNTIKQRAESEAKFAQAIETAMETARQASKRVKTLRPAVL